MGIINTVLCETRLSHIARQNYEYWFAFLQISGINSGHSGDRPAPNITCTFVPKVHVMLGAITLILNLVINDFSVENKQDDIK